jgi:uncharacterized protein YdhG (YjbR/CyaY superfamily)
MGRISTATQRNPMPDTKKPAKSTATKSAPAFTDVEQAAMKERAKELKAEARASKDRAAGEADLLAKVKEMPESDRVMAERIHKIVTSTAPMLMPKTWYGMPAYANAAGKIVCFFQAADKFKARYATFGFNDDAHLDDGSMWPTAFALTSLTKDGEARIEALVKKAVG